MPWPGDRQIASPGNLPPAMTGTRCPICARRFEPAKSEYPPFCSQRCRRVDLARWLDERYSVPVERDEEGPDAEGFDAETPDEQ